MAFVHAALLIQFDPWMKKSVSGLPRPAPPVPIAVTVVAPSSQKVVMLVLYVAMY